MHDSRGVSGGDAVGDLRTDIDRLFEIELAARDPIAQRLAVEQLHCNEVALPLRSDLINRDHIRMIER